MNAWNQTTALILGFVLFWLGFGLARLRLGRPTPAAEATETTATPPEASGPGLDDLQGLADRIETCANAAAHPGEVEANIDFQAAKASFAKADMPFETVVSYALGARFALSYPALAALATRPDRQEAMARVLRHFGEFPPWGMHFVIRYLDALVPSPPIGAVVASATEWWANNTWILSIFRERFERGAARGETPSFGDDRAWPGAEKAATIRAFLTALQIPQTEPLLRELADLERVHVDRAFLSGIGRFWDASGLGALAVTPEAWRPAIAKLPELLARRPARSLIAVGEPQTGKTTLLHLFAEEAAKAGWQIFEAGGAELMAGQQWFGQLEERLRRLVAEVTVDKKLVWYVPDLVQAARSGTHQGQAASILDQVLPAMAAGRIVLWTEATPAGLSRLLQMQPGLRNALEMVRLDPMDEEETAHVAREVATRLAAQRPFEIDPRLVEATITAATHHLTHSSLPGAAISPLKLTLRSAPEAPVAPIGPSDVVATLSRLTGLPASILDATERLDINAIRSFFAGKVMGQDEAVSVVVDRIAMLKAGLNDPGKPIGVFLFAGPTGTGKTELAKSTADYLFGSADRMIRLDMSEFQTTDSLVKILGDGSSGEASSLVARVRKQPFSLVLLDEFEKAHPSVWDLFLQVFDDARLSDAAGQVADFRHCIIILTSNLGATAHRTGGFGFAPPGDHFSSEQVMRAIAQTYRPEFQNRLDRVVVFQPLTRDLMRDILRKELDAVLARRGLKDRDWAVEWEPSAIEFLLEKGFSPEMGARPVKRAIDQHLLAPLAAAIVERRFPEGEQFVFVRADGQKLTAEFIDPDGPDEPSGPPAAEPGADAPGLPSIILAAHGGDAEFSLLSRVLGDLRTELASPAVQAPKDTLATAMAAAAFWSDPTRHDQLARYALIDRIGAALETAERLHARLAANADHAGRRPREVMSRLALQLRLVGHGLRDVAERAPVEAVVAVEPALDGATGDRAAARAWCAEVARMYKSWAARRNMQFDEVALAGQDLPALAVAGFGAHRVLAAEAGLHVFKNAAGSSRIAARVIVAAGPLGDLSPIRRKALVAQALEGAGRSNEIVRRYRREPTPRVRDGAATWRSDDVDAMLGGDFDLIVENLRDRGAG